MKKIISVINKKGGCGKTVSIMALADGLAMRGERVLVVDLDSQMNMSFGYGDFDLADYSIYDVMTNRRFNIYDAIQPVPNKYYGTLSVPGKVDILPANSYVEALPDDLDKIPLKEERLLRALQQLKSDDYDYILIDTAPDRLTDIIITNVLVASDEVLIPTKLESFNLRGIALLQSRIEYLIEQLDVDLKVNGVLVTQVNGSRKDFNDKQMELLLDFAKEKGIYVYESRIRNLADVPKKNDTKNCIYIPKEYERKTVKKDGQEVIRRFKHQTEIAKDYNSFIEEFLKLERGNENE